MTFSYGRLHNHSFLSLVSSDGQSNGYQKLLSEHECASASNSIINNIFESGAPTGCYKDSRTDIWAFNPNNTDQTIDNDWTVSEMFCKE